MARLSSACAYNIRWTFFCFVFFLIFFFWQVERALYSVNMHSVRTEYVYARAPYLSSRGASDRVARLRLRLRVRVSLPSTNS